MSSVLKMIDIVLGFLNQHVYRHLFASIAILLSVGIAIGVPQVRLLAYDVFRGEVAISLLTLSLVIGIVSVLLHFLLQPLDHKDAYQIEEKSPSKLHVTFRLLDRWIARPLQLLYRTASSFRRAGQSHFGYLFAGLLLSLGIACAVLVPLRPWPNSAVESVWPLWGGFVRMLGMMFVISAIWLVTGKLFGVEQVLSEPTEADEEKIDRRKRVWRRTGEVLSALLWLMFALELVWIAAEHKWFGIGPSVYTVWAFFVLAAGCCYLASLVDSLDRNTGWPWRLLVVMLLIGIASVSGHVSLEKSAPSINASRAQAGETNELDPASTESGSPRNEGGASLWLDTALARLQQNPDGPVVIITASGGGSRAALAAVLSLEVIESALGSDERPACVWLCSGVSGGGIALAANYYPGSNQTSPRHAVTIDFLAPMFRGFLVPFENRGESLSAHWDRYFEWDTVHQTSVNVDKPLLVFGVSDVDLGRRVMVGFPRLPDDWYARWTKDKGQWILSRKEHSPYSLSTLRSDGSLNDVSLTRAVRMTSSFPFGFEPTHMTANLPEPQEAEAADVHFLDGGMTDNTGLDSVVAIMSKVMQSRTAEARLLAAQVRRRGVFLIEIDAGASPGEVAKSGPVSRLTQPFGGYNRGVYTAAMRAREENIAKLSALVGRQQFIHEPIEPIPQSEEVTEIMTTLALPRHDVFRLTKAFADHRDDVQIALQKRYDTIFKLPQKSSVNNRQ